MEVFEKLVIERDRHVGMVTIRQSAETNVLDSSLTAELSSAFLTLNQDAAVRAVILKAEGESFLAGADLKEISGLSVSQAYGFAEKAKALQDLIIHSGKPYIAVVNGYCLGSGLELILTCDFRISGPDALYGMPEINLGLIPGGGGITRLQMMVGKAHATDLIYTGKLLEPEEALSIGLVRKVSDRPLEDALLIAESLANKSSLAFAVAKQLFSRPEADDSTLINQEMRAFSMMFDYPDSLEGIGAFLEQRQPVFKERREMST
ncbi:enoyl-CoA hydratase [Bhargavaea ginsengi]|uniref:Enoyl-CoA hydratase n=1 Tax=Bhargavaea ginsengi TaxID=426757 RepID=A0A1H6UI75_9BACL|nr:enoyl-CoA hydratase/isomerase family protein [Bhargavaea ginsengi]MCM3087495.1 enoyl-CoA hydratase/isomerase family protein [Bhargavaea ginsengi]SEI87502.1 enoyl-CoA hydratase [Bhargavaea ginsengi]